METIKYGGLRIDAQYIGYYRDTKVFVCQDKIIFTDLVNEVTGMTSLITFLFSKIDDIFIQFDSENTF